MTYDQRLEALNEVLFDAIESYVIEHLGSPSYTTGESHRAYVRAVAERLLKRGIDVGPNSSYRLGEEDEWTEPAK